MRVLGFCVECKKIRYVRVTMGGWTKGIPTGVCSACDRRLEEEAKQRG